MRKFFKGLVVALAATFALGCASAATVETSSDNIFDLTLDTTGAFTDAEDEYCRTYLQSYGKTIEIQKVSMVVDGKTVDVTDFAVIDGTDGNNTLYINSEKNKDESIKVQGYSDDPAVFSKVTSVTYTIKFVDEWTEENWFGGAIGTNSKAGWGTFGGQWTTSTEEEDPGKMFYIVKGTADAPATDDNTGAADDKTDAPAADNKTDNNKETGDATSVAVLAVIALAAMSGAVVVSKKRA